MKRLFAFALMLTLTTASAFAAKNSQTVNFAQAVKVGSTKIPAGDCKVSWTGTGDAVQVTLAQNGKSFTVPAKLVSEKHPHTGYSASHIGDSDRLDSIQFSNITLLFEAPAASGQ
jgi:opacity protein-like surface antigen